MNELGNGDLLIQGCQYAVKHWDLEFYCFVLVLKRLFRYTTTLFDSLMPCSNIC